MTRGKRGAAGSLAQEGEVRVLFVCIGNVCRSPLAEVVLRRMAADAGTAVAVSSAGTWAEFRQGMHPDTAACATRHGLNGSAHISRMVTPALVAAHDVVVALDERAGDVVRRIISNLDEPPSLLVRHVLNPWGLDTAVHEFAYEQIVATCAEVLEALGHSRGRMVRLPRRDR